MERPERVQLVCLYSYGSWVHSHEDPCVDLRPVACAQPLAHHLVPLAPRRARVEPVINRHVELASRCVRLDLIWKRRVSRWPDVMISAHQAHTRLSQSTAHAAAWKFDRYAADLMIPVGGQDERRALRHLDIDHIRVRK